MNALDLVLSRLDRVQSSGSNQWKARCPAHDDKNPSLSVALGEDGRVLLHCHAGCGAGGITAAIGLDLRDLYPGASGPAGASPGRQPKALARRQAPLATAEDAVRAATASACRGQDHGWGLAQSHVYLDATGQEAMRVLRFESPDRNSKVFRPISRVSEGWRIGDPEGALVLYRLPTLADASMVFVVEGEKAADAAVALGLVSTTSAHGASSAKRSDWTPLAGKDVAILPDNDEAGRKYAEDVASILTRLDPPARVRVVDLPGIPDHGDIVEFIDARRAAGLDDPAIRAEVEQLVAGAPSGGFGGSSSGPDAQRRDPSGCFGGAFRGGSGESKANRGSSDRGPEPSSMPGRETKPAEPRFGEPEPLPHQHPSVDRFDPRMLPRSFEPWIVDITERIQCPMDFPAVAAMVALASVLGRKVGIRPKQCDDWLVVANLWGSLIGRPGVMKTPPLQEATRPLRNLEIEAKESFEVDRARYEAEQMVFEARKKDAQGAIKKEIRAKDEDGAVAAAQSVIESAPEEPARKRYIVNDSTVEKLGEILNENPNGVLALRDELIGLLRSLEKEGQESARAFYLEAWNGTGRFTYDRISRGTVDIEAAIVSVLGSIQPGPLAKHLRDATAGGRGDDGLMSRFQLAVWPDLSREWRNVDRAPDASARSVAYGVFAWIDKLVPEGVGAETGDGCESIPFLRFEPRAQRVFDRWLGGLERRLRCGEEHPALESHFAKYRSLIPSLALLIHLADGGSGPVKLEALRKAIAWGRYLSSHARRIYSSATRDDVAAAHRLVSRIRKGQVKDGFTERDVYHKDWSGLDRDAVGKAVVVLVDHGWLCPQVEHTEGRTKTVYRINPRILQGPKEGTDKADRSPAEEAAARTEGTDRTDRSPSEFTDVPSAVTDKADRSSGDWEAV